MATVKEIFEKAKDENGNVTLESFEKAAKEAEAKFFDLSEGNYVSKKKYEDEIATKDGQINDLNETIKTRDTDLAGLQKQLEDAGNDATKLTELNTKLANLQSQYDEDMRANQEKLNKQAYEFAVKDFANSQQFTSNAAKRDFISAMISKDLKMDNGKILGADDFVTSYTTDNADAFVVEEHEPEPPKDPAKPLPQFASPSGNPKAGEPDKNAFAFSFTGVRQPE